MPNTVQRMVTLTAGSKKNLEEAYEAYKKEHSVVRYMDSEKLQWNKGSETFPTYIRVVICVCKSHKKVRV